LGDHTWPQPPVTTAPLLALTNVTPTFANETRTKVLTERALHKSHSHSHSHNSTPCFDRTSVRDNKGTVRRSSTRQTGLCGTDSTPTHRRTAAASGVTGMGGCSWAWPTLSAHLFSLATRRHPCTSLSTTTDCFVLAIALTVATHVQKSLGGLWHLTPTRFCSLPLS
jgi:hypothetical protein